MAIKLKKNIPHWDMKFRTSMDSRVRKVIGDYRKTLQWYILTRESAEMFGIYTLGNVRYPQSWRKQRGLAGGEQSVRMSETKSTKVLLSLTNKTGLMTSMRLELYLGRNVNKVSEVRGGERGKKESCSFSKLSVTSPTSQLILQPFRRFTQVTAHFPTLPLLHLRHSSFSNPSFASPTSQALHLCHLASRPWKAYLYKKIKKM